MRFYMLITYATHTGNVNYGILVAVTGNIMTNDPRQLQRYMIAACSDKLAQTISPVSVLTVMLYGIMVNN